MCLFVWERENGTWKEREKVNERKRERDKRKKWLRVNDKNLTFNGWLISLSLEDSPSAKRGSSKNNKIIKNFATFDAFRDKTTVYLNCGLIKRMKNEVVRLLSTILISLLVFSLIKCLQHFFSLAKFICFWVEFSFLGIWAPCEDLRSQDS